MTRPARATSTLWRLALGVLGSVALAGPVWASEGPKSSPTGSPVPSISELRAELEAVEANPSLEEATKAALRRDYEQAIEALRSAAELANRAREYREILESGAARVEALRAEVQALDDADAIDTIDRSLGTEALQQRVTTNRVQVSELEAQLTGIETELQRLPQRPVEITERISAAQRELTEARTGLAAIDPEDASPRTRARARGLQARIERLTQELQMLSAEQLSLEIRDDLLDAERELVSLKLERARAVSDALDRAVRARLSSTADRLRETVAAVERSPEVEPAPEGLLDEARELAGELDRVARATRRVKAANDQLEARLRALNTDFTSIREQLGLGIGGRAMVQMLFTLDRQALRAAEEVRELGAPALDQVRLASVRLRDRRQFRPEREPGSLPPALDELVSVRREALQDLERQYGALIRSLAILEQRKRDYRHRAEEIHGYINEKLFGFGAKACPTLGFDSLLQIPGSLTWLIGPAHLKELAGSLSSVVTGYPVSSVAFILLVVGLLLARHRLVRALQDTGQHLRKISTDRYRNTLESLFWSVLLAAPIPIAVGYAAWTLRDRTGLSDWMWGLIAGLEQAALILAAGLSTAAVLRPGGLGEAHFGWPRATASRVRSFLLALLAVYVPAHLVTVSCSFGSASVHFESLGRASFMVAHLWMAFLLFRLLHTEKGIPRNQGATRPRLVERLRPIWSVLAVLAPLVLVVLAVLGYLITGLMLSIGLLATGGLIAAGAVGHGLVLRGFLMRHRKLALGERLERLRSRRDGAGVSVGDETSLTAEEEVAEMDLDAVAGQIRQLLLAVFGLLTLVAVLAFWSSAFPLVELSRSVPILPGGGLSLLQLGQLALIVVVTSTVVRTLPGLLELAVLRATRIVPGTRHAIHTLGQYAAMAIGAGFILDVIEIDWAQFGWIAAALSVGLGFGLQEVVANFICGLILLFERPIRVGDIVTVEGTTGTVSRIQMRATTIVNWDRQEFVVPNKTLITSTLLNWTLSEPLNRIVIPVGVAYGSDTDRAMQLLREIATAHPRVLEDPEPFATFEQFGDSSLNLVLRAFLENMDSRLATITELHSEIHRRFAAAGIEIAFPQRDLHLRSGWERLRAAAASDEEERTSEAAQPSRAESDVSA